MSIPSVEEGQEILTLDSGDEAEVVSVEQLDYPATYRAKKRGRRARHVVRSGLSEYVL